jgi:antitoxin (DNA-binding transcriptional repressor) of toxin-antitoxin stability system
MKQKTVSASEFKAKCLKMLERLDPQGIVITKRGQAIAKVIPFSGLSSQKLYGSMKSKIEIKGDIFSTGINWDAQS